MDSPMLDIHNVIADSRNDVLVEECSSPSLLQGKEDYYEGIIVDPPSLASDSPTFLLQLRASLAYWKSQNKRGIWLKLPIKNADLVQVAVQEGFIYHHAEPEYLMLTKWLHESDSTIPANASHVIGVGAIIINDKNEMLVVQEISGRTRGSGTWKIPTGVVQQGEDIVAAVEREVEEETKIKAEFLEVLGFRHTHNASFGKSDLFFLCALRPTSSEIVPDEVEIKAAKWMPIEDFKAQSSDASSDLLTRFSEIISAYLDNKYTGFCPEELSLGPRRKEAKFYHNLTDIKKFKDGSSL